jgi:hypothetical protein
MTRLVQPHQLFVEVEALLEFGESHGQILRLEQFLAPAEPALQVGVGRARIVFSSQSAACATIGSTSASRIRSATRRLS